MTARGGCRRIAMDGDRTATASPPRWWGFFYDEFTAGTVSPRHCKEPVGGFVPHSDRLKRRDCFATLTMTGGKRKVRHYEEAEPTK